MVSMHGIVSTLSGVVYLENDPVADTLRRCLLWVMDFHPG